MPLTLFYTMVQKSQKWPKTQIKGGGGSCLKCSLSWYNKHPFWSVLWIRVCQNYIIIGSAEALPILCMRCARWEREIQRERERERERERDGSDVTLVALKLAMSFALFLAKNFHLSIGEEFTLFLAQNLHLSFSPLERRWVHTFRCQQRCTLRNSSHSSFCFVTEDRSTETNDRISGYTVLLLIEKMNQINTKNYWK